MKIVLKLINESKKEEVPFLFPDISPCQEGGGRTYTLFDRFIQDKNTQYIKYFYNYMIELEQRGIIYANVLSKNIQAIASIGQDLKPFY